MKMKVCSKCKKEFPATIDFFYKHPTAKYKVGHDCKKCRLEYQKAYQKTDKGKLAHQRACKKDREKLGNLYRAFRLSIWRSLKGNKSGGHWEDLVEYTLEELKDRLESLFTEGMSWENYGKTGWTIDHIRPVESFNITSEECEDFKECWKLENLQPLWHEDNSRKGAKYENINVESTDNK